MEMNLLSHFSVSDLVQCSNMQSPLDGLSGGGIINEGQVVEALKATLIVDNVCAGLFLRLILHVIGHGEEAGG